MFKVLVVAILRLLARWNVRVGCGDRYVNREHRRRCRRLGRIGKNLSVTTPACKLLPGRRRLSGHRENRARSMLSTPAAIVDCQSWGPIAVASVAALAAVGLFVPADEKSWAAFFAPGTGVLSKTESEDGNTFTRGLRNSISCEEEPTRIL